MRSATVWSLLAVPDQWQRLPRTRLLSGYLDDQSAANPGDAGQSGPVVYSGFLLLAVVLDPWSRRIIGWSMAAHLMTELVLDAIEMALAQRWPQGVIHYSDHGCQYTLVALGKRGREAGARPSIGTVGDAYDNAMYESFFATSECELLDRNRFHSHSETRMEVFSFIEGWYNPPPALRD